MNFFSIRKFLFLSLIKLNYFLIPIFIFLKSNFFIYLLLRMNLRKIKKISCKKEKRKIKIIVLGKSGGLEDLASSEEKYNNHVEYYHLPRPFVKAMFKYFINDSVNIGDYKYFDNSNKIKEAKNKYRQNLVKVIRILKDEFKFDAFIGFNFNYYAERELHGACTSLKIKFIILQKESVWSPNEEVVIKKIYKDYTKKFEGFKIGVYSENEKKLIINSKVAKKNQIKVIGCSRLDKSFLLRKIKPKNQVVYYMIEDTRGLPYNYFLLYNEDFKKQFKFYGNKNYKNLSWSDLRKKTTDTLIQLAKQHKNINFIFKGKVGVHRREDLPSYLPSNCKLVFGGTGDTFLKDAKIVIGWNSTIILEAMAANRFILLPYFDLKNNLFKKKFEIDFRLNSKNKGFNQKDFVEKFNILIKKSYKNKKINYDLSPVKFHLGNSDGNSAKRLNKFLTGCFK